MNTYMRFFINGIIFLIILFAFDQVTGRILKHFYFTSQSGDNYKTTYSMDSTKSEIIILGSSRASHHYIPALIEDSLNLSCFNTGRDGNFLLFSYAIFKSILKRHNPKIIILDISSGELQSQGERYYEGLSTLLPYYDDKPELRKIIELKGRLEPIKMLSAIYPMNSSILAILAGNVSGYYENNTKGYLPLLGSSVLQLKPEFWQNISGTFDLNKTNAIDSMAFTCNEKNIKFVIIQSPRYAIINDSIADQYLENLGEKYSSQYWNFVNDSIFLNNPNLFKDGAHLNDEGANIFTQKIIQKLK